MTGTLYAWAGARRCGSIALHDASGRDVLVTVEQLAEIGVVPRIGLRFQFDVIRTEDGLRCANLELLDNPVQHESRAKPPAKVAEARR